MAKSLRSSKRKANNRDLRRKVFAPVEVARLERLSTKIHNISQQPEPSIDTTDTKKDVVTFKSESKAEESTPNGTLTLCKAKQFTER